MTKGEEEENSDSKEVKQRKLKIGTWITKTLFGKEK